MPELSLFHIEPLIRISALCSAFITERPAGYYCKGESHDFSEALFVLEGSLKATAGGSVYELTKGSMILHPPGEFHRIINESDTTVLIGIVSFKDDIVAFDKHLICPFEGSEKIIAAIENIRKAFEMDGIFVKGIAEEGTPSDAQIAVGELERLLLGVMKATDLHYRETKKDRLSKLYSTAVRVMKRDLGRRMSTKEIADECQTSVSTLQKTFSKYTGIGVMKYYERIRMDRAKELLESGNLVKETALSLGYTDQNYFSASYKRFFGFPPSGDKA